MIIAVILILNLGQSSGVCLAQGSAAEVAVVSENTADGIVLVVKNLASPRTAEINVWMWEANVNTDPPMIGTVSQNGNDLVFKPRFPISAGNTYNVGVTFDKTQKASNFRVDIPSKPKTTTKVEQVYPSAEVLPENMLKFYVHFSAPMRKGDIYRHLQIREVDGQDIELPFLEIEQEFWSRDSKRLTLLLDPGRIKRGLKPREEMGPIFVEGKTYQLVIAGVWADANGKELGDDFVKQFRIGSEDHKQPNPSQWRIDVPTENSHEPLAIQFPGSLDHSMLASAIVVVDSTGQPVKGEIVISKNETLWSLKPETEWAVGNYKIQIDGRLEDNAGNSIEKPFDVDVFDKTQPTKAATTEVPFAVGKKMDHRK